jgi:ATP-dependent RNA helicase DDX23/PRP28
LIGSRWERKVLESGDMSEGNLNLSAEELEEAKRLQEIAERAERRAAERERERQRQQALENGGGASGNDKSTTKVQSAGEIEKGKNNGAKFLTKQEREELALQRLQAKRIDQEKRMKEAELAHNRFISGKTEEERRREERLAREKEERERERRQREENKEAKELDFEVKAIRDHYLGNTDKKRKISRPSEKFAKIFQFDWEADDDTAKNDFNPLYSKRVKVSALFGRGYIAGIDQREQRKESNFLMSLSEKRMLEAKRLEDGDNQLTETEKLERARQRDSAAEELRRRQMEEIHQMDRLVKSKMGSHWSEKALEDMTERDWRIFREDFDIRIQGGRATLPLRFWKEANFPTEIMRAIEVSQAISFLFLHSNSCS